MNDNDKKAIEAGIDEELPFMKMEQEAATMAAKNDLVEIWRNDSENLGNLIGVLHETATGQNIFDKWMKEYPVNSYPG